MPILRDASINEILKIVKNAIIKDKIASILFLICILTAIYSMLILVEWPMSDYDRKFIGINKDIDHNGPAGSFRITGEYRSKDIISANKEIELYIFEVDYYVNKESFKEFVGERNIWPNYLDVRICPDNARASGDLEWKKSRCINVKLNKTQEDWFVDYNYQSPNQMNKIEFLTSGSQSLSVSSGLKSYVIDNVFYIEPYNTYLQLQLNRRMYALGLLGIIVTLIGLYEFAVKLLKR